MTIENRLRSFITSDKAGALVLQGTWGRGKTHLWNALIKKELSADLSKTQYAYVSLFGVNSLDELKVAIYQSATEFENLVDEDDRPAQNTGGRLQRWFGRNRKGLQKMTMDTVSLPHAGPLSRIYSAFAFYRVRNMLVCLDDIERRGNNLQLKDVMGLVSLLWEQRGCRVVVVLNRQSLPKDDAETWANYKEKVFQGEVTFAPSAEQCINLVFCPASTDDFDVEARNALMQLDVTNIRIIERARGAIEQTVAVLSGSEISSLTKRELTRSLVWFVYCHSGQGEGAPPLDLSAHSSIFKTLRFANKENDTRTDQEKSWDSIRETYGAWFHRSFDEVLQKMVIDGYPDEDVLRTQVLEFDRNAKANAALNRFEGVWDLYHYAFSDNRAEIVDGFRVSFSEAASVATARTVDSTIWLLRLMGENELADDFIKTWIDQRSGDRGKELSPDTVYKFGPLTDDLFAKAIDAAYANGSYFMPLAEAIACLGQHEGNTQDAALAVANAPVQDLVQYIDEHQDKQTSDALRICLDFPPHPQFPHYGQAGKNARDALTVIAGRSSFAAFRIENVYNVSISATVPAQGTAEPPPVGSAFA